MGQVGDGHDIPPHSDGKEEESFAGLQLCLVSLEQLLLLGGFGESDRNPHMSTAHPSTATNSHTPCPRHL